MTTRLTPRAVKPRGEFMLGCREEELTSMQPADAVEFFHKQKIKGTHAEIEAACAPYGYHPLSLRLLAGRILKDFENPADIVVAQKLKIDGDLKQYQHHVLEVSYDSLPKHEQKLLSTIACFRSPVEHKTLEAIAENKDTLDKDLHDVVERGLLHFDEKNKKFDLHPIVRRYAYECLTAPDRTAAHTRLRDYFAAVEVPAKPQTIEDIAPIIELYHHMIGAGEFYEAAKLFYDKLDQILYHQFGRYQSVVELILGLFADNKNELPSLEGDNNKALVLESLANAYSMSGQPRRAIPIMKMAFALREKTGKKQSLAIGLGNLANGILIHIGKLKDAEINLLRSVDLCREVMEEKGEAIAHEGLGRTFSCRGIWKSGEDELEAAMSIYRSRGLIQSQSVLWGYRALQFLMKVRSNSPSKAENLKSAIECSQYALEKANETTRHPMFVYPLLDFMRAYWLLGAASRASRNLPKADNNLNKAIGICRQINNVAYEANILLDLARLRYDQKKHEESKSLADEALLITERCGYVLQGADVNLFLAQYALEQEQDKVKAKKYAEEAKKLATCDGPPYYYKVAYEEAERMLEKLKAEG